MSFLGLSPLAALGVLGYGLFVVVVLYLRQWGRRRVVVAYAPLWQRVVATSALGGARRRIVEVGSFLLQAAIALVLVLALARPYLGATPSKRVLVLDTSASMLTLRSPRGTRFDEAQRRALDLVDAAASDERIGLVVSGGEPRIVRSPTDDHLSLRRSIAQLQACDCEGHLGDALSMARALADGDAHHVQVLSDGNEPIPDDIAADLVGDAASNVGVTLLGVRPIPTAPGRYQGVVEVANFSTAPARAQLRLSIAGRLVDVIDLSLAPGERKQRALADLSPSGSALLQAELADIHIDGARDGLPADDRAFALLAPESVLPVRLVAAPGKADLLRSAIAANPRYRVVDAAPGAPASPGLTVAVGPVGSGAGRYLLVGADAIGASARKTGTVDGALFSDWRIDHPVLRHASLDGVAIRHAPRLALDPDVEVLASYGDAPLLYCRDGGARMEVGLAFDPEDSNLPLRVAFPVIVYNALDWLAGGGAASSDRRSPGERWRIPVAAPDGDALVESGPGTARAKVVDGTLVVEDSTRAGLYVLSAGGETLRVAASLASAQESDVHVAGASVRPASQRPRPQRELWPWLALLSIALLLVEWQLFHRRKIV